MNMFWMSSFKTLTLVLLRTNNTSLELSFSIYVCLLCKLI